MRVTVLAQPFFAAHAVADAVAPSGGSTVGSSQPFGTTVSAVPWKMITGLCCDAHASSACAPPECGATARISGRMQPAWCEKYPPIEKPVTNTWSLSMH